jgi:hypothetical protein
MRRTHRAGEMAGLFLDGETGSIEAGARRLRNDQEVGHEELGEAEPGMFSAVAKDVCRGRS